MVACARAKHSARRPLEGEGHRALQAPAKRWTEAGEALSPSSSSSPVLAPRESVALSGPNSVAHSAASRSLARSAIVGMRKKGVWGHLRIVKIIPHRSSQIAGPGRWPCPGPPCSSPPSLASFVHSFKTATATTVSIKVSLAGYSKSRKFTKILKIKNFDKYGEAPPAGRGRSTKRGRFRHISRTFLKRFRNV